MSRQLTIDLLNTASTDLKVGEATYIPCADKYIMLAKLREFKKELSIFQNIDTVAGSQLRVYKKVSTKGEYWIVIEKIALDPLTTFKKAADGTITKTQMNDPERTRRLYLMAKDGLSLEEVEAIEGPLSTEERARHERRKR